MERVSRGKMGAVTRRVIEVVVMVMARRTALSRWLMRVDNCKGGKERTVGPCRGPEYIGSPK